MRLKAGEGLRNARVGRRFLSLLPCVAEMDGDRGPADSQWCVCELDYLGSHVEEHLKDPGRHLNLSIAERVFPAGRVCAFVFACES